MNHWPFGEVALRWGRVVPTLPVYSVECFKCSRQFRAYFAAVAVSRITSKFSPLLFVTSILSIVIFVVSSPVIRGKFPERFSEDEKREISSLIRWDAYQQSGRSLVRATAKWRAGVLRSAFGSLAFSVGLLIMGAALVARGILDRHGSFAGIVLWLFCGGVTVLAPGPVYDLVQSMRKR